MTRRPRPIDRSQGATRDARLIVIASEDRYAAKRYFSMFRPVRAQFKVLPTEDSRSAPFSLMRRLDEFRDEFQLGTDDELWICLDTDHWAQSNHIGNLSIIATECEQKGYKIAFSNPCFEIWLLLHFCDLAGLPADVNCSTVTQRLKEVAGGYNKNSLSQLNFTVDQVHDAMSRAHDVWPQAHKNWFRDNPGTYVHMILQVLQEREHIVLAD